MLRSLLRARVIARTPLVRFTPARVASVPNLFTVSIPSIRHYSDVPPLTKDLIKERLLEILEGYDKVPKDYNIAEETNFSKDLGLDSLDIIEVVMAIEEEFSIGIPDDKVDKINSFKDALELVANDPNAS